MYQANETRENSLKKNIKDSENEICSKRQFIYTLYMSLIIIIEIQEKFLFYIIIITYWLLLFKPIYLILAAFYLKKPIKNEISIIFAILKFIGNRTRLAISIYFYT